MHVENQFMVFITLEKAGLRLNSGCFTRVNGVSVLLKTDLELCINLFWSIFVIIKEKKELMGKKIS